MNKVQEKRLIKVAVHLETGKLGHKKFAFYCFNRGPLDKRGCGALGCAIGEFPIIFPRTFEFSSTGAIGPKNSLLDPISFRLGWFGINSDEEDHLFYPGQQEPEEFGGKILTGNATRKAVAKNIRAFIKVKNKDK